MTTARHGPASASWRSLAPDIEAALSDVSRTVIDAVEAETQAIYRNARDLWPVKSGKSRDSLGWKVTVTGEGVEGSVRAASGYARYINSAQIAISLQVPDARIRAMHRHARTREQHQHAEQVEQGHTQRFRVRSYAAGRGGGKLTSKAAKSGNAGWLLLKWPERAAGERLTEDLRPLVEADLAGRLEG